MIVVESANEAWLQAIMDLSRKGHECAPRGLKIKEIENYSICITNPKKRIITNPIRKMSLPYAFGELIWYLSARNDVKMMEYYSKRMKNFSDDGKTLNSAYGYRIFGRHPELPFDQWAHVVNLLKADPDSRQAIIHLHTPNNKPTKDEVCTLTLQFMIRDGALDMFTNMRSNDCVWGFTYDVFAFTIFQELIANELNVPIGKYFHTAASFHIYEKDFAMMEQVEDLYNEFKEFNKYQPEFGFEGLTRDSDELHKLISYENALRGDYNPGIYKYQHETLEAIRDVLRRYQNHKKGYKESYAYDNILHIMMKNHINTMATQDSELIIVEGVDGVGKTTYCANEYPDHEYIHFEKPKDNFNPLVYLNTILSRGKIILDRSFYSELVYADYFKRRPCIGVFDTYSLETILKYKKAKLVFMIKDPKAILELKKEDLHMETDIDHLNRKYCNWANSLLRKDMNVHIKIRE